MSLRDCRRPIRSFFPDSFPPPLTQEPNVFRRFASAYFLALSHGLPQFELTLSPPHYLASPLPASLPVVIDFSCRESHAHFCSPLHSLVLCLSLFSTTPFSETQLHLTMPRPQQREVDKEVPTFITMLIEQGWVAFVILGIFMIALRLYNVKQRNHQRQLLREGLMAEMGYKTAKDLKKEQ